MRPPSSRYGIFDQTIVPPRIPRLEKRNYFVQHDAYRAMWDRFNREGSFPL